LRARFIPLRTDRDARRRPIVTESLVALNLIVYLAGLLAEYAGAFPRETLIAWGALDPQHFRGWQLVTSTFLHDPADLAHLGFNMLFLWVFGSSVEDRLGRTGFLAFYLGAGIVSGLGHVLADPSPAIGASGAVCAVSGAFLALFPRSTIRVLVVFFVIGVYNIPSLWFIGIYFALDVLNETASLLGGAEGGVAYMAHIAGSLFGFSVAFALLGLRIVRREEFDIFFLLTQARRRAAFRAATRRTPAGAWESASADTSHRLARQADADAPLTPQQQRQQSARAEIARLIADHRLDAAAARYRELMRESPDTVLAESRQLDVANQLYAEGDHAYAAAAYELLLDRYPRSSAASQVRLMLGLLYARRLHRPQRARELIELARPLLRDTGEKALADQVLAELAT
jgi:membrane associated rhomboid family serine protease